MRLERLSPSNAHLFDRAFKLYQSAFPIEERRDDLEQQRVIAKDDYHFDLIMNDDTFIGVMLYWETENFIFLEHFTTLPDLRGQGYGKCALNLLKDKNKVILLEIDPPVSDIAQRRYNFYKRNSFIMNPYHHIQAKYHLGDADLELKVLSYPRVLEKDEYRSFYEYMTREIGIKASKATDITVRKLEDGDNLDQVAKLIYLTDPYVYPNWFDSIDDGIKVIQQMIKLPTLYNKENITVAIADEGFVAGIIVSKQTPFTEDITHIRKAFELADVKIDHRTDFVFDSYYSKMGAEDDGYYIANVAVDDNYRKRGIAASMIDYILQNKEYCTLEAVIVNIDSWRLYQRMGFHIDFEYPGVHGIPCYKMHYKK